MRYQLDADQVFFLLTGEPIRCTLPQGQQVEIVATSRPADLAHLAGQLIDRLAASDFDRRCQLAAVRQLLREGRTGRAIELLEAKL